MKNYSMQKGRRRNDKIKLIKETLLIIVLIIVGILIISYSIKADDIRNEHFDNCIQEMHNNNIDSSGYIEYMKNC